MMSIKGILKGIVFLIVNTFIVFVICFIGLSILSNFHIPVIYLISFLIILTFALDLIVLNSFEIKGIVFKILTLIEIIYVYWALYNEWLNQR